MKGACAVGVWGERIRKRGVGESVNMVCERH
jgi:hypothetical protein